MPEKLLAVSFAISILIQAWILRMHVGTWLFPACLYGVFWFLYTFIPLVALPAAKIESIAVFYILVSCLLFSSSAVLFKWKKVFNKRINIKVKPQLDSKFMKIIFYLFAIFAVTATIINWRIQGISYLDILFDPLYTSGQYLGKRYSGELIANIAAQLSIILTYPTAIFGGILYASREKNKNGLNYILVSFASSILMMVVEANKGALFLVMALFWAGILVNKINNGEFKVTSPGGSKTIILYALPILAITIFSFLARGIETDGQLQQIIGKLYYYFVSYSSGHLYAFSDWFSSLTGGDPVLTYSSVKNSNGFYTFMAIFSFFGSSIEIPPGVYDEYFYIEDLLQTNIYTHYRGLILDFGMFGALVVVFFGGLLTHVVFYKQLITRWPSFSVAFFTHFIGYLYTSFIVSLLIWNSIYASFIIVSIVLLINNLLQRKFFNNLFLTKALTP